MISVPKSKKTSAVAKVTRQYTERRRMPIEAIVR